jgi:hypothetical protein
MLLSSFLSLSKSCDVADLSSSDILSNIQNVPFALGCLQHVHRTCHCLVAEDPVCKVTPRYGNPPSKPQQ